MQFQCPSCHHDLEVTQQPLPEVIHCTACGGEFSTETDATADVDTYSNPADFSHDEGRFVCPHCQNELAVDRLPPPEYLDCNVCGSAFPSQPDRTEILAPGSRGAEFAHFELLTEVGSGSYGVVWRARDTRLDRIVALKIPRRERLTPNEVERFLAEAQTAAQLRHPGIVSIHDTGRVGPTVYIATDFVEGETLDRWLASHKVAPKAAAEMCAQVADALHHAHESGIIHRDIKPSNIMVDSRDRPYITDFGLAKRESVDATIAVEGSLLGTPAYMSPEQARGEAHTADRRTDLYSLGVILFQMLTGERPFRGSRQMILQQVVEAEPPHPRRLNSNVPEDLDTICFKCLEKQVTRRYESANEVADELRRYLRGEPIKARPITRGRRLWRWCQRNPITAGLLAALALTLMLGLAVSTTQWLRANRHAEFAMAQAAKAGRAAEMADQARRRTERYLYVANMNSAQQAYELADPGRVIDILRRYANPEATDHRSFEWYYWWRQAQRWSKSLEHASALNAVSISVDGSTIASASVDGTITIWDTVSGGQRQVLPGHEGEVFCVAFSPADEAILLSSGRDRTIRLWDIETGAELFHVDLPRAAFSLACFPDGQQFASAGADTNVTLWSLDPDHADQPVELTATLKGHFDFVYGLAVSSDGSRIASTGLDRTVRLWDADQCALLHTMEGHELEGWAVAFAPTGSLLASGSADHTVRLWDTDDGTAITVLRGHTDRVRALAFSPDATRLVSASHDRSIRLWDMTAESRPLEVFRRNLNRSDRYFFELMQLPNANFAKDELKGHSGHVTGLAWSNNGKTLLSCGTDQRVRLWNIAELEERSSLRAHTQNVNAIATSGDSRTMLSASNDRTVRFWDLTSMQQIGQVVPHDDRVACVAIAPDGRTYATGTFGGVVRLGPLTGVEPVRLKGHEGPISSVAFSEESNLLASSSHDGTVRLWDVETGQPSSVYSSHVGRVQAAVFLGEGKVASAGADQVIRIWDPANGESIAELSGHSDWIWSLAVSPNGKTLASAGLDRTIRLWNLDGGGQPIRVIRGHAETVRCVAFCPDGRTLASSSDDKTVRLWDLATGEPKATFEGHKYRVWSIAFTPDARYLLSASVLIRAWHAPRNIDDAGQRKAAVGVLSDGPR